MHRDLWSVSHVPWLSKPDPKVFVGMMSWWDLWLETSVSQCSPLNTFHRHQSIRSGVGFSQADGHRASLLFPCMSIRKSCCWGWLSRPLVGRSDYGEFCSLKARDTKLRSHFKIGSQMSSGSTHGENKRDLIKNRKTEGMSFFGQNSHFSTQNVKLIGVGRSTSKTDPIQFTCNTLRMTHEPKCLATTLLACPSNQHDASLLWISWDVVGISGAFMYSEWYSAQCNCRNWKILKYKKKNKKTSHLNQKFIVR